MSNNDKKKRARPDTDNSSDAARLAKITPPRLRNVLKRERLFRMLDGLRDQPVLWLSAPAGAGKTLLIASWAAELKPTLIWFQCDEGDGDIAAFFHFLSLALINVNGARAKAMPRLTPDLYAALTIFVRNYCREFFAQLKAPALIVFDNWQEVPAGAPLRELLPVMMEEVPHGITLAILSREAPDARFSRALSTGHMTVLGWSELQFTETETSDLVAQYEPMPGQHAVPSAHDIYAITHGWAAGTAVLLRRHEFPVNPPNWSERNASNQAVFDYLASEVFDRLEPALQDFMLKTACLKSISVDVARDGTGNESAQQILERLVNRNVFTLQRPGSASYEYHPLLREFLKNRFVARSGMPAWRQHERQIADVLVRHGQIEAAIGLLLEAAAWSDAARLIMSVAPMLAQQGRFKTLIDWITAAPDHERQSLPWLKYWLGASQLVTGGIATARTTLEMAYAQFVEQQDMLGQMLCAVDIAQSYQLELADLGPMVSWLHRLGGLLDQKPVFPSAEIELRIYAGYVGGLSMVEPSNTATDAYANKLLVLMDTVKDVNSRAYAMGNLLMLLWNGDIIRFTQLRPIADSLLARRDVAPALQVRLKWAYSYMVFLTGDFPLARALLDDVAQIAASVFPVFSIRLTLARLQGTDLALHQQAVDRELISLAPVMTSAPPFLRTQFAFVQAVAYFSSQKYIDALESARQAHELSVLLHYPYGEMMVLLLQAEIHCELNQFDEAAHCLNEVADRLAKARSTLLEFYSCLVSAELARRRGDADDCDTQLRKALAIGRVHQYATLGHRCSLLFMHLIPVALERGIETEYCLRLIDKLSLKPPSPDIEQWPWPIKIFSLGRFEILVDGEKLESGGRTQHKPLDLLKALLTNRSGLGGAALIEQLWPDLDGDAARNALNLALHRLRRLLKRKDAVVMDGGNLALDPEQMWVDAWALEALCDEPPPKTKTMLAARIAACVRLSRGNFLADQDAPWVFATRDRLSSKLIRMLQRYAAVMQDKEQCLSLTHLYQQLIEADPVNEALHRGLIQSYRTQGLDDDALTAYRRYRELTQRLLGREPPITLRALVKDLL